jgi:type VI secretion system ImpM family protein
VPRLPVACFGKLPFHREFLRLGLSTAVAAWVVRWVEDAHASLSQAGAVPAESQLVRFAAALSDRVVAGVVRQSSDGLRRYPVTFFIEDALDVGSDGWHLAPVALEASWA